MPSKVVLVVEDDESVRLMLVRALSATYTVLEASDGIAAFELVKKNAIDLIISDVMMPRMNGYALSRLLKADNNYRTIPVIFLTARTSAKDVVTGINAGARHYIAKPFSVRDILDKVKKILK